MMLQIDLHATDIDRLHATGQLVRDELHGVSLGVEEMSFALDVHRPRPDRALA
jgi:hypothetical protein